MMRIKWIGLMMVAAVWGGSAFGAGKDVTIAVKGMVCGFCAQGIEKKFSAQPSVEKVKVSLSDKQVKLSLKEGQDIPDELLKQILADAGYGVEKIERH